MIWYQNGNVSLFSGRSVEATVSNTGEAEGQKWVIRINEQLIATTRLFYLYTPTSTMPVKF